VRAVGQVLGLLGASPSVAGARADVGGFHVSVSAEQLLQADDSGQQKGELADDQGLSGEQEEGSQGKGDEHTSLQQGKEEQRSDLLDLATS